MRIYGQSDARIAAYVDGFIPEDDVLADVQARSRAAGLPAIEVGAVDGRHLTVLAEMAGARRAVEIGTLGGYSGVCLLRGMRPEGMLDTFESEPLHAEVARETFARAGFGGRARVHVGPAVARLPEIEPQGPFDLVFIDADKESYPAYLAWAGEHLRVGGVVLADNAFHFGDIVDTVGRDGELLAMRAFVDTLFRGGRFEASILPTGEGLAIGVKRR